MHISMDIYRSAYLMIKEKKWILKFDKTQSSIKSYNYFYEQIVSLHDKWKLAYLELTLPPATWILFSDEDELSGS